VQQLRRQLLPAKRRDDLDRGQIAVPSQLLVGHGNQLVRHLHAPSLAFEYMQFGIAVSSDNWYSCVDGISVCCRDGPERPAGNPNLVSFLMSHELQVAQPVHEVAEAPPMSPDQVRGQINLIQNLMRSVMRDGEHYGVIPGCGKKPALLKAGAEKLCMMFRLSPRFEVTKRELPDGHREYEVVCSLVALATGNMVAQGLGLCSSMESKYRWRKAEYECPACGKETIRKSKDEAEFYCWRKIGGCGATFDDRDPSITMQQTGRVPHPDIADTFNTILKMAKKRAQVDATISATAASDIFTQDVEETAAAADEPNNPETKQQQPANPAAANGQADSEEFRAFHAKLVDLVDPENYGDLWEGKSANVYTFLTDSGAFKAQGFESLRAVKQCRDASKFAALLKAAADECQKRADNVLEIPW
jgi:predicted RNA-binding Zn-ribbon protein involved in translation (DUF1610 family)